MEQAKTKTHRTLPILLCSFILIAGGFYSAVAKAETSPVSSLAGQQLAYFIGYHSSPGYVVHGPGYVYYGPRPYRYRKVYWTGWRYVGHGCRRSCLVDRWSGRVLRCKRVCRR